MLCVPAMDLDGRLIAEVDLMLAPTGKLLIDGHVAVKMHLIGSIVALWVRASSAACGSGRGCMKRLHQAGSRTGHGAGRAMG